MRGTGNYRGTRAGGDGKGKYRKGKAASPVLPSPSLPSPSYILCKGPCKRTQDCLMLLVAYPVARCYVLLGAVAQSLKPVKRLATCKWTQQLLTLLRLLARSLTFSARRSQETGHRRDSLNKPYRG